MGKVGVERGGEQGEGRVLGGGGGEELEAQI